MLVGAKSLEKSESRYCLQGQEQCRSELALELAVERNSSKQFSENEEKRKRTNMMTSISKGCPKHDNRLLGHGLLRYLLLGHWLLGHVR